MARDKKAAEEKTGVAAWNEGAGISTRAQASESSRRGRAAADRRRRIVCLVALAALCVAALVCAWPPKDRIERGLWLKGGTAYSFTVATGEGNDPSADELQSVVSAIQGRLSASGVSEYAVATSGSNTVVVKLPKTDDADSVARLVAGAGLVEFVRVDEIGDADALAKLNAGTEGVLVDKTTYKSFLDSSSVTESSVVDAGSGSYAVRIVFNEDGAKTFATVTKELSEDIGRIAIMIDGRVVSAPSVSEEIDGGEVYISGNFSKAAANALKSMLDGETLPLVLTYQGSQQIGALLSMTILWGIVGVAVAAIVLVSALAYRHFKKLAVLVAGASLVFSALMLGLMALASRVNMFVLTVPGVFGGAWTAAVSIMAVWLVTAHFQAKANEGHSIKGAARTAPQEGLRTLRMPCAVAFVIALVLLFVPMAALRDFGLTVVFGFVCGLLALYWYAITTLRLVAAGTIQADPSAWGVVITSEEGNSNNKENAS